MNFKFLRYLIFGLLCLGMLDSERLFAQQDFPVSAETGDPALLVSPALIGEMSSSAFISINYKSQVKNAFNGLGTKILSANYEQTFFKEKMALALGVYSNTLNKSALSDFSVELAYRYTVTLGRDFFGEPTHRLSFGLEGVYRQWAFSSKNLNFGSQYDPAYTGGFNPALTPETDFISDKKNIFDVHFGMDYKGQLASWASLQVGGSLFHLVRPETNFLTDAERIAIRTLAYVNARFTMAEVHALIPSVMGSFQGNDVLIQAGVGYQFNFSESSYFGAGLYYRSTDVMIPTLSLGVKNFVLSLSMEFYMKTGYGNMMRVGMGFPF